MHFSSGVFPKLIWLGKPLREKVHKAQYVTSQTIAVSFLCSLIYSINVLSLYLLSCSQWILLHCSSSISKKQN